MGTFPQVRYFYFTTDVCVKQETQQVGQMICYIQLDKKRLYVYNLIYMFPINLLSIFCQVSVLLLDPRLRQTPTVEERRLKVNIVSVSVSLGGRGCLVSGSHVCCLRNYKYTPRHFQVKGRGEWKTHRTRPAAEKEREEGREGRERPNKNLLSLTMVL